MSREQQKILNKIISLIKGIHSVEPSGEGNQLAWFGPVKRADYPFARDIPFQWWYTKRALIDCWDLSHMVMEYDSALKDGDQKTFASVIVSTLQEHAWNPEIFDGFRFFINHAPTLFAVRKIMDGKLLAEKLWGIIHQALLDSITIWLVLYPLPRLKSPSFSLGFDGISLLPAEDCEVWQKLSEKYCLIDQWNPVTGELSQELKLPHSLTEYRLAPPLTWLACELYGTEQGSIKKSKNLMCTFLSVLFSHLMVREPGILDRILSDPVAPIFRFSSVRPIYSIIQALSYFFRLDIEILDTDILALKDWYNKFSVLDMNKKNRTILCSQFIQKAIMDRDIDEFIHYFIALDALFGTQYHVEDNIIAGVSTIFQNSNKWDQKIKWLYRLRNDLVHGGCSSIEEWVSLDRYNKYFRSNPLHDIGIAAMTCLQKYPEL